VRCGHDSTIRAGVQVGENGTVGAKPVLQRDVPAHHVAVGTPPESITVKPGRESVAEDVENANGDRREERRIEYELPDDLDTFDEFGRDLHSPRLTAGRLRVRRLSGRSTPRTPPCRLLRWGDVRLRHGFVLRIDRRSSPIIGDHRRPLAVVGDRR
jgi:hypothetical protein